MSVRVAMVGHVDHGKSTLIGRLLADTHQAREERQERVRTICEGAGRKFEYAFLLDALEEEQTQGITIDVTEVKWDFSGREYLFVDTPGHREFLKKMVGGASKVDAAVLLVDAMEGVKEGFRRQLMVLDLLGVRRKIVVVNKMDLAGWSWEVWAKREQEIRACMFAGAEPLPVIPAAAWHGASLLERSAEMPWYKGPTLAEALEAIPARRPNHEGATRFWVQDVYRHEDKRIYAGRVEAGSVNVGDTLLFHPGMLSSRVRSIEVYGEERYCAVAGEAVGITLEERLFLDRGTLGFASERAPLLSRSAVGDIFWLDASPLKCGERVKVRMGTRKCTARVAKIEYEINGETFSRDNQPEALGMFGRVHFQFNEDFAFDRFEACQPTGRFVISRDALVVGGGRWVGAVENSAHEYAREGSVLWLTGLSGAGKSTLATALGKSLKERGERVTVLDGDVLRQGLCKDLGFSQADRTENLRRAAEVAKLLADEGFIVITAFISPLASQRAMAKECIGEDRFKEVFVDCPLEICESRDPKGLYKKARQGELPEFTGITSPFEPPIKPDIHLRTDGASVEETVQRLNSLLPPRDPGRVH